MCAAPNVPIAPPHRQRSRHGREDRSKNLSQRASPRTNSSAVISSNTQPVCAYNLFLGQPRGCRVRSMAMSKSLRTSLMGTVAPAPSGTTWPRLRLSAALASAILLSRGHGRRRASPCRRGRLHWRTPHTSQSSRLAARSMSTRWDQPRGHVGTRAHSLHPGPRRRHPKRLDEAVLQLHRHTRGNGASRRHHVSGCGRQPDSIRTSVSTT